MLPCNCKFLQKERGVVSVVLDDLATYCSASEISAVSIRPFQWTTSSPSCRPFLHDAPHILTGTDVLRVDVQYCMVHFRPHVQSMHFHFGSHSVACDFDLSGNSGEMRELALDMRFFNTTLKFRVNWIRCTEQRSVERMVENSSTQLKKTTTPLISGCECDCECCVYILCVYNPSGERYSMISCTLTPAKISEEH